MSRLAPKAPTDRKPPRDSDLVHIRRGGTDFTLCGRRIECFVDRSAECVVCCELRGSVDA